MSTSPPLFAAATKKQARLRLALIGPSGSGKTYSALAIATALGDRVALIDTEHGSASKYAGDPFSFDVLELDSFHPQRYIDAIAAADHAGYDVVVVDSLSHAWVGKDGELQLKERAEARAGENSFTAWRHVTPLHHALVESILQSRSHVIVTMRAKTEYVLEPDERGKQRPRKIGLAPVMRDGIEYEFDVAADIDLDHRMAISKTRCAALDGQVIDRPGAQVAETLRAWLTDGEPVEYAGPALVAEIDRLFTDAYGGDGAEQAARDYMQQAYGTQDASSLTVAKAMELRHRLAAKAAEATP